MSADPSTSPGSTEADAAADEAPSIGSLVQSVKLLIADVQGALQDRLALLGLELRLAAKALGRLLVLAVVSVLLVGTAWVLLIFGLYAALLLMGMGTLSALGLLVALNLGGAALAGWLAWRSVERLTLPATMRRLRASPLQAGPADESDDGAAPAISPVG